MLLFYSHSLEALQYSSGRSSSRRSLLQACSSSSMLTSPFFTANLSLQLKYPKSKLMVLVCNPALGRRSLENQEFKTGFGYMRISSPKTTCFITLCSHHFEILFTGLDSHKNPLFDIREPFTISHLGPLPPKLPFLHSPIRLISPFLLLEDPVACYWLPVMQQRFYFLFLL